MLSIPKSLTEMLKKSPNFRFRSGIDHTTKVKMRHWSLLTSVFLNSVTCALKDKLSSATLTLSIAPHIGNRPIAFAKENIRQTNTCPFNTSPPPTALSGGVFTQWALYTASLAQIKMSFFFFFAQLNSSYENLPEVLNNHNMACYCSGLRLD